MGIEYSPAPSVEKIAKQVIADHHEHLLNVRIEFVFRSKAAKSGDKEVWGKARKISGLNAFLSREHAQDGVTPLVPEDDYFVIEIARDIWAHLTESEKIALVDHELSHCDRSWDDESGETKLSLISHDVEEFASIIERHGLWRPNLRHFFQSAKQLSLLHDDGPEASAQ